METVGADIGGGGGNAPMSPNDACKGTPSIYVTTNGVAAAAAAAAADDDGAADISCAAARDVNDTRSCC